MPSKDGHVENQAEVDCLRRELSEAKHCGELAEAERKLALEQAEVKALVPSSTAELSAQKMPSKDGRMENQAEVDCLRRELSEAKHCGKLAEAERKLALEQAEGTE